MWSIYCLSYGEKSVGSLSSEILCLRCLPSCWSHTGTYTHTDGIIASHISSTHILLIRCWARANIFHHWHYQISTYIHFAVTFGKEKKNTKASALFRITFSENDWNHLSVRVYVYNYMWIYPCLCVCIRTRVCLCAWCHKTYSHIYELLDNSDSLLDRGIVALVTRGPMSVYEVLI